MNRLVRSARDCRIPFTCDGIRPKIGCDANAAHRCLTIPTSATTNALPGLDDCAKQKDYKTSQIDRTRMCQKRGYHQFSRNYLSSNFQQQQQLYTSRLQVRHFVFDSRKAKKAKKQKDPFKVLKVPKESLYKDIKTKFLKIAMANHPDMHSEGLSEKEQEAMRNKFIEARMAFERLEEDPEDGTAILVEDLIDREKNFDSWFKNETGLKNPFDVNIDPETMKEVAEMTEKLGGMEGMARDGGSK